MYLYQGNLTVGGGVVGGFVGGASHVVSSYVLAANEMHPTSSELKNPINFQVGLTAFAWPSHRYDRTRLFTSPCPGKVLPKAGVKWYGFGPKYELPVPQDT